MTETEEAVASVKAFLRVNRLVGEGFIRNGQILSWKTFDTILAALERAEADAAQWKAEAAVTFANGRDALASEREARERAVRLSTAAAVALATLKAEVVGVVSQAEGWFLDYERQHRAKGTPDADAKADANRDRAATLTALLAKLNPADTPSGATATDTGRNT
jgi:hypothetical protein